MKQKTYLCLDLKSFYSSVECVERGLDPLANNLIVADESRTEKTICLAVSPSLKACGVPGRPRLFEVVQQVKRINAERLKKAPNHKFTGRSYKAAELANRPELELSYIIAPPRMAYYIDYSTRVYKVYLKHISPQDIIVYSIDEVFIDLTSYLITSGLSAHGYARMLIEDVLKTTGITATAGIGTNLYLAKIAMDIVAKRMPADKDGVRIAELDEMSYRKQLWNHRPLADFWRVGKGYAKKLEENGIYTMGDVARCSVGKPNDYYNEELLYKFFGINAELLIDHAWGYEPCTVDVIKQYKPSSNSICSGQVLKSPYTAEQTRLVVHEMADSLALGLVEDGLVTDQTVLTIGYDVENLTDPERRKAYHGKITTDNYGRQIPKHSHGTANLGRQTSSAMIITEKVLELFDRIIDKNLLVRRLNLTANHIVQESSVKHEQQAEQLDFFTDYEALEREHKEQEEALEKERNMQQAVLKIKKKYGKNAVLKGMSFKEGATAKERNDSIGGHKK